MLTREQILSLGLKKEKVDIPELGDVVYVRELTAKEQDELAAKFANKSTGSREWMAIKSVCDEAGNPIFTDKDFEALSGISGNFLNRVLLAASKISGLSEDEVKELSKN